MFYCDIQIESIAFHVGHVTNSCPVLTRPGFAVRVEPRHAKSSRLRPVPTSCSDTVAAAFAASVPTLTNSNPAAGPLTTVNDEPPYAKRSNTASDASTIATPSGPFRISLLN